MIKSKTFDCVDMKNKIQAKLQEEYEGLTLEEVRKRRRAKLEASKDPLARKFRRRIQVQIEKRTLADRS